MQLEWKKTANEYMIENKRITNQMGDLTMAKIAAVSYTHLTLPTNREV